MHTQSKFELISEPPLIASIGELKNLITIQDLERAAANDPEYCQLSQAITHGFPESWGNTPASLRAYWNVRNRLSIADNIIMMNDRVVVPASYRAKVLRGLHSAHQGVSSMLGRAHQSVYWPGLDIAVRNTRYSCHQCNELAPSQPREPLCSSRAPLYPFQQICLDYFELGHHSYLSSVDRFSGWLTIYHFQHGATATQLISICRALFTAYGVPEELSSDGGPQFTSDAFQRFLRDWGVEHRLSSVEYPQSNGRAEVGVKSAKRIIRNNASPKGSLDTDNAARAILQYRNTPLPDLGLSPAQLLLHRQLRDSIPTNPKHYRLHKEWVISAWEREKALARRNEASEASYNVKSHQLSPLNVQTAVRIQSKNRWDRTGRIIEALPHRQYRVRVDGSGRVTLRNRKFLRVTPSRSAPAPVPSMTPRAPIVDVGEPDRREPEAAPMVAPEATPAMTSGAVPAVVPGAETAPIIAISEPRNRSIDSSPNRSTMAPETVAPAMARETPVSATPARRLPRALRNLADYNEPGLAEVPRGRTGGSRSGR